MIFRKYWAAAVLGLLVLSQTPATIFAAEDEGYALIFQSYSGGDLWSSGLLVQAWTIDGKLKSKMFGKPVKALAGKHIVGLHVEFRVKPKNYLTGQTKKYADIIEFPVTLMSGRSYTASGRQSEALVEIWIVDTQTQELVSEVVEIYLPKCKLFSCPPVTLKTRPKL